MANSWVMSGLSILIASSMGASAWCASLGQQDRQILEHLAKDDQGQIGLGKMAKQHSSNPSVQDFGKRMIEDHSALDQKLKRFASSQGVSLPSGMLSQETSLKKDLQDKSGKSFDQKYVKSMLKMHRKDIAKLQKFMETHPHSQIRPLLAETIPILENHVRVAEHVAGEIGESYQEGLNIPVHPPKKKG